MNQQTKRQVWDEYFERNRAIRDRIEAIVPNLDDEKYIEEYEQCLADKELSSKKLTTDLIKAHMEGKK